MSQPFRSRVHNDVGTGAAGPSRSNRLNFIRHYQKTLRVESYSGLADHVNALDTEAGMRAGVTLILPSSVIGSPRAMQQNFQDTTSVVRDFGKPDLFLTFTCNPKWKEIKDNLFAEQKAHDHPDLIARIFDINKKSLLKDLKKNGIFGRIMPDIHVIEFQKRGPPHMHILLILTEEDKIRDPDSIDLIVSAELPDKTLDPKLHEIVKSRMIHGPCGVLNPNSPCIVDGVCLKGYPKQFRDTTDENIDVYHMCRLRESANNIVINGNVADNRWLAPYKPFLNKKYNVHINVKIFFFSSIKSIKYIFKYVYKGHDCT
ncbi:helitron_like_N domain-containing protein [Trichonephila clavipes]|nr:helitron_like_N domain-containing protein [Trichonephila clavipes]